MGIKKFSGVKKFLEKKTASDCDIDAIISGTYVDDGKDRLIAATDADIDAIISGIFKSGR